MYGGKGGIGSFGGTRRLTLSKAPTIKGRKGHERSKNRQTRQAS